MQCRDKAHQRSMREFSQLQSTLGFFPRLCVLLKPCYKMQTSYVIKQIKASLEAFLSAWLTKTKKCCFHRKAAKKNYLVTIGASTLNQKRSMIKYGWQRLTNLGGIFGGKGVASRFVTISWLLSIIWKSSVKET